MAEEQISARRQALRIHDPDGEIPSMDSEELDDLFYGDGSPIGSSDYRFHLAGNSDSGPQCLPHEDPNYNPFVDWPGHSEFYKLLLEVARTHAKKNSDYANSDADPLRNFRECEKFGIDAFDGVLTRKSDKWMRVCNLRAKERNGEAPAVADEALEDTLIDDAVYALIALVLRREKQGLIPVGGR